VYTPQVLQRVLDGALLLVKARYGMLSILNDEKRTETLLSSGMTPEEFQGFHEIQRGDILRAVANRPGALRVADFPGYIRRIGLPEFRAPVPISALLVVPVGPLESGTAHIYVGHSEQGVEFSAEDEETLEVFASLAALAIANSMNYETERQARNYWQAMVDMLPVGIWAFETENLNLTSINREALRIVGHQYTEGMSLDEVRAKRGLRYPDGRDVPTEDRPVSRVIRTGETIKAEELTVIGLDGKSFPGLFSAVPIYSSQGEMSDVILTMEDLSPREDMERLRSEFLGMVSHELRTPLTSIKGSAATALSSSASLALGEARLLFRIIDQQADQMHSLINNLLDLTRIEAGQLAVSPEAADLGDIIEQARNTFESRHWNGSLEVDCPAGLPRVMADEQRVAQVLDNLLSNAAKFSPEQSTINIRVAHKEPYVEVSVTDQGKGVPTIHLSTIFAKFTRVDDSESGGFKNGHGLGLAICKGIVESHGGRIWVDSNGQGEGARFTFTLPVAEEVSVSELSPETVNLDSERTMVLIIDDDPQILRYLTRTLMEAGYETVATEDSSRVEHLLATQRPQLTLLDLTLSDTDAFSLIKRTPALLETPVIFISGNSEDRNITRALEAGADDYIIKPFSPTELIARIRAALRKQRRAANPVPQPYVLKDLVIDFSEHMVSIAGERVHLTATEYRLLYELALSAGRVLTHSQLLDRVWGPEYASDGVSLLRAFVRNLRKKLGDDAKVPSYILTEPRVGYRMATADGNLGRNSAQASRLVHKGR
ncbi:MAG: response regulator, partial [Chloroflexi bacterium]|nr:response regulator [Chloroflexota bacterium]